jgi:hypothetical protein
MRPLFEFSNRTEVRDLVSRVTELRSVQGVIVDYDPLWMDLWRLRCARGDRAVDDLVRLVDWFHYGPGVPSSRWWPPFFDQDLGGEPTEIEPPDPNWLPLAWLELQHFLRRRNPAKEPFIVKICLYPWQKEDTSPDLGEYPFTVVKERRAPAELSMPLRHHRPVLGGISIGVGAQESGTLGGIVEDQHGVRWGVTCAHVVSSSVGVDQPAQRDSPGAAPLGSTRYHAALRPSAPGAPCNPYNAAAIMNSVDAALIQFVAGTSADLEVLNHGRLSGVAPKNTPSPGQLVDIAGKESGSRTLEIGGLAVTYRLRDSTGNMFCFNELFELRWPRWWRVIGGRPVQRGDSGGWILTAQASGTQWMGMALASDRLVGYGMFAENVVNWAKANHGLDIRVV